MFKRIEKVEYTDREGNRVIEIREKDIPEEFHWLFQLKKLKEKYLLKFVYYIDGKEVVTENLRYFELDSKGQSYVPRKPDKVLVYDYEEGEGWVLKAELRDNYSHIAPDVDTAMKIWSLAEKI